tara:strand:+ start:5724 stop:5975 length:252 start_codon:yes stop_codon:yes gene_type:complete
VIAPAIVKADADATASASCASNFVICEADQEGEAVRSTGRKCFAPAKHNGNPFAPANDCCCVQQLTAKPLQQQRLRKAQQRLL